ncbi:MAG: class I tRNA ligase family protein [Cyclobacteriaceae bacterium]|nr:class I tRNA ligase family protein [Cyclobacteriaceae bacterium]
MADYSKEEIKNIEQKWRTEWEKRALHKVTNDTSKPKYYVLDMFPYPSGAGLHVGHPLGYIASDIVARYKRIKGFNVLHPMGFDAFGLPAEQYALEHGIHPAISTQDNINNFKRQLGKIGFCYDWSREVQTCDPSYYKWTQWIFLQIFDSWFNRKKEKAERISELITIFEKEGNANHPIQNSKFKIQNFKPNEWVAFDEKTQQEILMQYRLAYLAYTDVNWCEELGTVLANDEVINGVSYRGGFPVVKKQMRQWSLRITEYADRLLKGLDEIDFSESMKDIQRNWIGKSVGAELEFNIQHSTLNIKVFTTRPDTIFGVDFMVIAPEHELVKQITTAAQREDIDKYLKYVESRSEVDRMAEVKKVTGAFTGAYATNPFNGNQIPIWISEYVLAGYGTGAIMAVPCGDERDHKFAKHFKLPITNIIGSHYNGEEANPTKDAILENSDFLNGMVMRDAIDVAIQKLEEKGIGKRQVNYKMRDAGWSRQRYWGEPFPVVFKDDMPYAMKEAELPLELPPSDNFKPSGNGEGPLANLKDWINFPARSAGGSPNAKRDSNTMPTHAGAAWYFLRYMDPHNTIAFADPKALDYWNQVDVYIGGAEHAVAHLLYARLWTKVLHDLGYLKFDEPFKKLINQGKITGVTKFVFRASFKVGFNSIEGDWLGNIEPLLLVSKTFYEAFMESDLSIDKDICEKALNHFKKRLTENTSTYQIPNRNILLENIDNLKITLNSIQQIRIFTHLADVEDVSAKGWILDLPKFKAWCELHWPEERDLDYYLDRDKYVCGSAIEKMSKSLLNVENPDEVVNNYGADTLRMYEMFLGPLEASKPWSTQGIDGVFKFLRKVWNLIHDQSGNLRVSEVEPTREELKVLHKTIKKVEQDIENFSFNTSVSEFMICVNELGALKCNKRAILEPLVITLSPFAPHIAEELWEKLGHTESILTATYPKYDDQYLVESTFSYPISINGKVRAQMEFALDMPKEDIEKIVLASEIVQKWTEGKPPKKMIVVQGRIVNVVL